MINDNGKITLQESDVAGVTQEEANSIVGSILGEQQVTVEELFQLFQSEPQQAARFSIMAFAKCLIEKGFLEEAGIRSLVFEDSQSAETAMSLIASALDSHIKPLSEVLGDALLQNQLHRKGL